MTDDMAKDLLSSKFITLFRAYFLLICIFYYLLLQVVLLPPGCFFVGVPLLKFSRLVVLVLVLVIYVGQICKYGDVLVIVVR